MRYSFNFGSLMHGIKTKVDAKRKIKKFMYEACAIKELQFKINKTIKMCLRILDNMEKGVSRKKGKHEFIEHMVTLKLEEMDSNPDGAKKGHKAAKGKKKKDKKGGAPITPKEMLTHMAKITKMFMFIADFRRKTFMFRMEYAWHRRQPVEDKEPDYVDSVRKLK
jgi:hypothetical protein